MYHFKTLFHMQHHTLHPNVFRLSPNRKHICHYLTLKEHGTLETFHCHLLLAFVLNFTVSLEVVHFVFDFGQLGIKGFWETIGQNLCLVLMVDWSRVGICFGSDLGF